MSGNSKVANKESLVARAEAIGKGMHKRFPNGAQVIDLGGGSTLTVDAANANLQEIVDNRAAVTTAQAAVVSKLGIESARQPTLRAFMRALEAFVRFTCGNDATALAEFGLEPHKAPAPLTAEQKAAAAAKREATRKARGIIGSRKRAAVKGNVSAQVVVTASPPEPTPPPAVPTKS